MDKEMVKSTWWMGCYRGIVYEIACYNMPGLEVRTNAQNEKSTELTLHKPTWFSYLHFNSKDNPEILNYLGYTEQIEKDVYLNANSWWEQFSWHGGITYYKESIESEVVCMKIGQDYAYALDMLETWDEVKLEKDVKIIIDQYRDIYPENTKE